MTIRLGTRGSKLALAQAEAVAGRLRENGCACELVTIRTRGDAVQDRPLSELGAVGVFAGEIERALLEGSIDLAVHSLKDLPGETGARPAPLALLEAGGSARRPRAAAGRQPRRSAGGCRHRHRQRAARGPASAAAPAAARGGRARQRGHKAAQTRHGRGGRPHPGGGRAAAARPCRPRDAVFRSAARDGARLRPGRAGAGKPRVRRVARRPARRPCRRGDGSLRLGGARLSAGRGRRLPRARRGVCPAARRGTGAHGLPRRRSGRRRAPHCLRPAEKGEALARCLAQELRVSLAEGGRA